MNLKVKSKKVNDFTYELSISVPWEDIKEDFNSAKKKVSKEIAITVAKKAFSEGLTNMAIPQDIESSLDRIIYNPVYPDYT